MDNLCYTEASDKGNKRKAAVTDDISNLSTVIIND